MLGPGTPIFTFMLGPPYFFYLDEIQKSDWTSQNTVF